jgi:hypothetical protein
VWRTIERGDQAAFHQMSDPAVQRRTLAGPCKWRNVCDRRKWQFGHQLQKIFFARREATRLICRHPPGWVIRQ